MARKCSFPVSATEICGVNRDTIYIRLVTPTMVRAGSYCKLHAKAVDKAARELGLLGYAARADRKKRKLYEAASGETFSGADVRRWLIERGVLEAGSKGNIPRVRVEEYANAH